MINMKNNITKITQYDDGKGFDRKSAIAEANKQKLRMLSNVEIDSRLSSNVCETEKEMYPCWTGTLIAYTLPNQPLGKTIEFDGLIFNVPKKFQGKKNVAIVCNHPDFILNENTITPGKSAQCIPFPEKNGWYLTEKEFGIPNGTPSNYETPVSRYLWRWTDRAYTGLLSRYFDDRVRRVVVAYDWSYYRLEVFGTKEKFVVPKHKHEFVCKTCGVSKCQKLS